MPRRSFRRLKSLATAGLSVALLNCEYCPANLTEHHDCEISNVKILGVPNPLTVGQSVTITEEHSESGGCDDAERHVSWLVTAGGEATVVPLGQNTATLRGVAPRATQVTVSAVVYGVTAAVATTVIAGPIASIVISPATPSVPLGTTQQMSAAFLNAFGGVITGNTAAISWSVSPSNLATIDGTGFLAATATGTGTISATYSGVTPSIGATTALTVTGTAASITVSPAAPTLNVLGSTPLTATVRDAQGHVLTGSTLTWQSLNTAVATLSASTGATVTLTGVTAGSATVRVVADAAVQVDVPVTVAGCANPLVISDDFSTDTPGAWTTSFTRDNTGISNAVTYKPSAGNPGGYREMAHNMIGTGSLYVYHLREVEFDPSVAGNTIHHINYHEDQISIASAIGWGFFIEQNGVRHLKSVGTAVFNSPTWQTNAILNMTQADFPNVNFSAGKMKFGFYRANTSTGGIYTTTHGIDNFNVQVCR